MPDAPYPLRGDEPRALIVHASVAVAAGVVTLGAELGRDEFAPTTCQWCTTNPFDRSIQASFRWDTPTDAADLSNVFAFGLAPLVAGSASMGLPALDGAGRQWLPNLVFVAEAVAVTGALNQGVKFAVARERPSTDGSSDDDLSFYSGHTSLAFAAVTSAGTVAELRGYRGAWAVWAVGLPVATLVGYLRVAGDKHWASDVLVGAAVGGGTGVLIPLLLHPRVEPGVASTVTVSVIPGPTTEIVAQGSF